MHGDAHRRDMTPTVVLYVDLLVLHSRHLHGVQGEPQVLIALQFMYQCNACRQRTHTRNEFAENSIHTSFVWTASISSCSSEN